MKKIIKRYGNSNIIILNPDEMEIYKLKTGDVIDIEIKEEVKNEYKKL